MPPFDADDLPPGAVPAQGLKDQDSRGGEDKGDFQSVDMSKDDLKDMVMGKYQSTSDKRTGTLKNLEEVSQRPDNAKPNDDKAQQLEPTPAQKAAQDQKSGDTEPEKPTDKSESDAEQNILDELLTDPDDKHADDGQADAEDKSEEEAQKLAESMSEKQKTAFISQRQQIKELRTELESLRKSNGAEDLQKQLEQAQSKLAQYDLREDPRFRERYLDPALSKAKEATELVEAFGGDKDLVKRALNTQDVKERLSIISREVGPEAAASIFPLISESSRLNAQMLEALKNHAETRQKIELERKESVGLKLDSSIRETADRLRKEENHFLLVSDTRDEKWNNDVKTRIESAKKTVLQLSDPKVQAEVALKAAMAETYRDLFLAERQKKGSGKTSSKAKLGSSTKPGPSKGAAGDRPHFKSGAEIAEWLEQKYAES